MFKTHAHVLIGRPLAHVHRFVCVDFFENYPRWSPEVLRLEKLSAGPVRVGTLGRQVRRDEGRRSESTFRVSAWEAPQRIEFVGLSRPYYRVRYDFAAVHEATRIDFAFEVKPDPLLRPFRPVIQVFLDRNSARLVRNLKAVLESSADRPWLPSHRP